LKIFNLTQLLVKKVTLLVYLLSRTNFKGVTSDEDSDVILWTPFYNWRYFISERIVIDFAYINSLSNRGVKFKRVKSMDIGKYWDRTIYITYDYHDNLFGFTDYTKQLLFIIKELENQNNLVYPKSNEYLFWENKAYMHRYFEEFNIPSPKTKIYQSFQEFTPTDKDFPFLFKEIHSCSANGVHSVRSENDWITLKERVQNSTFLIQELLNIRKDLRVTIVKDKIEHFYWRINHEEEWKPTSTGHGSSVDFANFPEQWRSFIINEFLKLNIITGAFDIAWQNDDLNTKPLILEVSPTYQLNPVTTSQKHLSEYGKYKTKSTFGKESFLSQFVIQTFRVVDKIVKSRIDVDNKK
jgi:hypothetical protein